MCLVQGHQCCVRKRLAEDILEGCNAKVVLAAWRTLNDCTESLHLNDIVAAQTDTQEDYQAHELVVLRHCDDHKWIVAALEVAL